MIFDFEILLDKSRYLTKEPYLYSQPQKCVYISGNTIVKRKVLSFLNQRTNSKDSVPCCFNNKFQLTHF